MKLFSVTEVLSIFQNHLSQIPSHILERATERGIEVHRACALWASGIWVKKISIDAQGYFNSFQIWAQQFVEKFFLIEERLYDRDLGFHGRLDFYLKMVDGWQGVIDIKTPLIEGPTWNAQCSAYKHLVEKNYNIPEEIEIGTRSLQLDPKGNMPKAIPYEPSDEHFAAFLSALNAYRYFKG